MANDNVLQFEKRLEGLERKHLHSGGQPPYDGGMETRITKLENLAEKTGERLMRIETRLDTFATKEDLYRAEGSIRTDMHREFTIQTWRIIGAMITFGGLLVATTFFIARNVH